MSSARACFYYHGLNIFQMTFMSLIGLIANMLNNQLCLIVNIIGYLAMK